MSLYLAALFVAFVPGVLVSLPPKGSKYMVLAVHSLLFVLVWHLTQRTVWRLSIESFQNNSNYNNSGNNSVVNNTGNNGVVNNTGNNSGNNSVVNNTGNNGLVNNNGMNATEGFGCAKWQRWLGLC